MMIGNNIFNDAVNITNRIDNLRYLHGQKAIGNILDKLRPIMYKVAARDVSSKVFSDLSEKDKYNMIHQGDIADYFGPTNLLKFVPINSFLWSCLVLYYSYVDSKTGLKGEGDFRKEIPLYARGGVVTKNGFYYTTGIGYYTNDELFAGMSHAHVGSKKMSRKFLHYINYTDRMDDHAARKLGRLDQMSIEKDCDVKDY